MRIILDLHGCIIKKFPLKAYQKAVSSLINWKIFSSLKSVFCLTGAAIFTLIGMKDAYIEILDNLPTIKQKDKEMIEILKSLSKKHELVLVTDTTLKNAIKTLKAANLKPEWFKQIIAIDSDWLAFPKPATDMYEKVGKGLVIGDRVTDLIPAQKLGWPAFLGNYNQIKKFLRWLNENPEAGKGLV